MKLAQHDSVVSLPLMPLNASPSVSNEPTNQVEGSSAPVLSAQSKEGEKGNTAGQPVSYKKMEEESQRQNSAVANDGDDCCSGPVNCSCYNDPCLCIYVNTGPSNHAGCTDLCMGCGGS